MRVRIPELARTRRDRSMSPRTTRCTRETAAPTAMRSATCVARVSSSTTDSPEGVDLVPAKSSLGSFPSSLVTTGCFDEKDVLEAVLESYDANGDGESG
mmetsp:Transcript_8194/g.50933  ORF Transcript_8194/g.50933 Transcript_8194/m.50933 type:complete len:99 (+) Transcript_8194:5754-6050(+)